MRTAPADQSVAAFVVLEDDEIFAEQPHRLDRPVARQFIDQSRRLPIVAHDAARRRAGARAGDEIVLLCAQHWRAVPDRPVFFNYRIIQRRSAMASAQT